MQILSLSCPSVTYAQKGRRILAQAGIKARIIRRSRFGCSYGLECASADPEEVLSLLRGKGVPCEVIPRS
ncbi:MAG: DUF3343 domain-containing protein [Clostridia bacterium]|nr:DUF3343 domain-containing protein [Clostridia bacterium]